jgi:hypothetical protein
MNKKILIGVILSCFLLLVTPCINAVEYKEINNELKNKIDNRINTFHSKIISLKNCSFNNLLRLKILLIIYIIGYITFLPIAWFLTVGSNPYGNPSFIEILIETILGNFMWPIILLAIIKAYLE